MMGDVITEKLIPGISGFIARHSDLPLGLATNAEPANVDFVLRAAGIREYFRAIVNGQAVERPKPFPDIYLRVAQLLGSVPEFCVVFEDSHTGVEAARAAGMRVVGVATTLHDFPDVDLVVSDFLDPGLEKWLGSLTRCT
jgi:HAD superfamily hydrolase (TIGR01509 family)